MNITNVNYEKIRLYRKLYNLTQDQLGELIGKSRGAILKYESGSRNISVDTLKKLCDVFKIDIHELLNTESSENECSDEDSVTMNDIKFNGFIRNDLFINIFSKLDDDLISLLFLHYSLNQQGKERLTHYISDLSLISKYIKDPKERDNELYQDEVYQNLCYFIKSKNL